MKQFIARVSLAVCSSLIAAASIAVTSAQVLLSDTFSRNVNNPPQAGGPSGWGANDNLLGGLFAQTYLAQLDATTSQQQWVNGTQGLLRRGTARINLDLAPLAPGGFTLSFDATRSSAGGFVGFTLGLGPTNVLTGLAPTSTDADFSFLLKPASGGFMQLEVLTNGVSAGGNYGAFGSAAASHNVVATLTPNGYTGTANIAITVDGNNALTGPFGGSFNWQNDGWQGYLGFSANNQDAIIDNLIITAVPEPTSLALLGFGVLGLLGSRFRRQQ